MAVLSAVWVDDSHAIYRRGLAACLASAGFLISGESTRLQPPPRVKDVDVLVFECTSTSLTQAVGLVGSGPTLLVATVRAIVEGELATAIKAGVTAIVCVDDLTPERLVATVRAVATGTAVLPGDLLPRLLAQASRASALVPGGLAPRERDVLKLLADGFDTREIAVDLCYSERTVKNVVHDLLLKLNCRNRAHAVAMATRAGVI